MNLELTTGSTMLSKLSLSQLNARKLELEDDYARLDRKWLLTNDKSDRVDLEAKMRYLMEKRDKIEAKIGKIVQLKIKARKERGDYYEAD